MMLGASELIRQLELGRKDPRNGISLVPSPLNTGGLSKGAASIDLRLGRWFLSLQQSRTSMIDFGQTREAEEFEAREGKMNYVPFGRRLIVHPGRFVLGSTLEWIRMPPSIGGHITGKSSVGRRGLVIETAAGLHPLFSGCITLELSNCGEVPVALVPGMPICQVFFHEVSGPESDAKTIFGGRRRPTFGPYNLDQFVERAVGPSRQKG